MKLWKIVGLMICLSILVVMPVCAQTTSNAEYLGNITEGTSSSFNWYDETVCCALYGKSPFDGTPYHGLTFFHGVLLGSDDNSFALPVTYNEAPHFNATGFYIFPGYDLNTVAEECQCTGGQTYSPRYWHVTTVPNPAPDCSFVANPTSRPSPLLVSFMDQGTGINATSWSWGVVDNTTGLPALTSTLKNFQGTLSGVNHQYDVYLSKIDGFGGCTKLKPNYITTTGTSNTTQYLIIEATDVYSNALVSDTTISVKNTIKGVWTNVTASGGTHGFVFDFLTPLYIEGIAPGYSRSTKSWTVVPYSAYILKLPMYPTGTVAAANVSLNVVVLDGGTSGVFENAQVRLSDGQVKFTSGAGVAVFNVSAVKSYQIVASHSGYTSATRTLTTGSGGTSQDTYLTLNRIVVTTAPTLPPGVTAVVTQDTRTNAQKDQGMMDQVREWGSILIPVACLMTLLYMFGYKA